jgi:hypothetical protein
MPTDSPNPSPTAQESLSFTAGDGHEVTIEEGRLGDDPTFASACSCGHRSAPSLCEAETRVCAHLHVPLEDRRGR